MIREAAVEHADKSLLHQRAHFAYTDHVAAGGTSQIAGAMSCLEHLSDGGLKIGSFMRHLGRMAQQHGYRSNRAQGVGGSLPGNIGRRAVDRLIKIYFSANGRRGS